MPPKTADDSFDEELFLDIVDEGLDGNWRQYDDGSDTARQAIEYLHEQNNLCDGCEYCEDLDENEASDDEDEDDGDLIFVEDDEE